MASSLKKQKTVDEEMDEFLAKYRAVAKREQKRVDELEEQKAYLASSIGSSLTVPTTAFAMSYVRAYYGEAASVFGMPIDAAVGLLLHGLAACFGFSSDKGAQAAAKVAHDVANGALASWTVAAGAEIGLHKRMEKPLPAPAPQLSTGAVAPLPEMPKFGAGPLIHADLAAIKAAMASHTKPAMPEQPLPPLPTPAPAPAPALAPLPFPVQHQMSPSPTTEPVAAKVPAPAPVPQSPTLAQSPLNGQATPSTASTKSEAAPAVPSIPQKKPFRFTQRCAVDPEADMRALLQSLGAPADPNTVAHLLSHENPGEELRMIVRRARAPA